MTYTLTELRPSLEWNIKNCFLPVNYISELNRLTGGRYSEEHLIGYFEGVVDCVWDECA